MAFRFRKKDGSVERALRRIAREQFDLAVDAIDDGEDLVATVHEVRQRCKKLRGLIRLVRPSFERYADENSDIREIARLLGGVREMAVLLHTYERLAELYVELDPEAASRFGEALQQRRHANPPERLRQARERLVLARRRVADWTLAADGWEAIGPGLMRTYMRARTALEAIGESHASERFHNLRKHVKYHWHHVRLLRPIRGKELHARADQFRELGERLGTHHDLAVLESTLRHQPETFGPQLGIEWAQGIARRDRLLLEEPCLRDARRLLDESAESLTRRLGSEWDNWRD